MPHEYETRRQRALQRLGSNKPVCAGCPEARWQCLELHHIAGQKHHDDLSIVCRNCHRFLSDAQKDHPADSQPDSVLGRYLLGLADLLLLIAGTLKEFGLQLIAAARPVSSAGDAP